MLDKLMKEEHSVLQEKTSARRSFFNRNQTLVLAVVFLFIAWTGNAETYYVSNSGNDANSGTTPESAWQTINKVNNTAFAPGDRILFQRGDEWREQLTISSSGISGNPIVFDAYGSGARPVINGSDLVTNWNQVNNSQVWQASVSDPKIVLFDNKLGRERLTKGALDTDGDWFWSGGVLYIYSDKAPSARKTEVGARNYGIYDNDNSNFIIQNIEVKGTNTHGIGLVGNNPNSYVTIDRCYIHHTRMDGIIINGGYGNVTVRDSKAEYTGSGFYCSPNSNNNTFIRDTANYNIHYIPGTNTRGRFADGHGFGNEASDNIVWEYCYADGNYANFAIDDSNTGRSSIIRYCKSYNSQSQSYGYLLGRLGSGGSINMYYNL